MSTVPKALLLAVAIASLAGCAVYPPHGAHYAPSPGYTAYRVAPPPPHASLRGFSHRDRGFRRW